VKLRLIIDGYPKGGWQVPRIQISDAYGTGYEIATRDLELLERWLDEVLPHVWLEGRPADDFDVLWPRVNVWPMWAWGGAEGADPDWLQDSRVLGRRYALRAKDGKAGMAELARIRAELETELATL
jgi:hypothetical protein